jgi:hypothetical protein
MVDHGETCIERLPSDARSSDMVPSLRTNVLRGLGPSRGSGATRGLRGRRSGRAPLRGLALIEVAIAFPIVLIALGMLVQMLGSGVRLRLSGSEAWAASCAAQTVLESMRNEDFRSLVALYNSDPLDDPGGPGTAPGNRFVVDDLTPLPGAPRGTIGEVFLPLLNTGSEVAPVFEVREDIALPDLGLPRDLNGDAVIDANDHRADYSLLPVEIELRWLCSGGPRLLRITTILSELR